MNTAQTLLEALPYLRRFQGTTITVALPNGLIGNRAVSESIADDLILLKQVGIKPVILDGDLAGSSYTTLFTRGGGKAVSIGGEDGDTVIAYEPEGDLARVAEVHSQLIETLLRENYIPIVSSSGGTRGGEIVPLEFHNFAVSVSRALSAAKLILFTLRPAKLPSLMDFEDAQQALEAATGEVRELIAAAILAIKAGVRDVHILPANTDHSLIVELFTDTGAGTMITNERVRV